MKRLLVLCAIGLGLSGCNAWDGATDAIRPPTIPLVTFAVLDGASVINTQKTLDDHVVSLVTGKDCSTVRASMGEKYCQDKPEPQPTIRRTTYCYKSLASVSCYDQPYPRDADRLYGTRVDEVPFTLPPYTPTADAGTGEVP